jgi:hypothetical protein
MKKLSYAVFILVVAGAAYGLGRMQGRAKMVAAPPGPFDARQEHRADPTDRNTLSEAKSVSGSFKFEPVNRDVPYAQNMTSAQRGFEAARLNVEDALKQVETLPVAERMGFISGIFSFVAKHHTPADGLKIYQTVPEAHRPNALRALVAEWIYARSPLEEDMRYIKREGTLTINGSRLGLEVELSSMLASSKPDAELATAWLDAFSNHSSRSEILLSMAGSSAKENVNAALDRTKDWTAWEKERVTRGMLSNWASEKAQEAWEWYLSERGRFEQDFSSSILAPWAIKDPEGVKQVLGSIEEPGLRQRAIETIGKMLGERYTDAGVEWAEGLADSKERELAQRAVYDGAPRGIGAVLDFKNGFPTLRGIVPGSPLEGTGAKAGDHFVEVQLPDGSRHPLYGKDLTATVNLIRGEPGSEMTLRILREGASGKLEEHLVPVRRGQLYLDQKTLPKS